MELKTNITEIKNSGDLWEHLPTITRMKAVTIDTETSDLDPYSGIPILFQIGNDAQQFVIHWYNVPLTPLKKYLEDPDILKIFHNAKFDYKFIKHHAGIEIDTNIFDTMIAELILLEGLNWKGRSNLEYISKKYLNIELDKETRKDFIGWRPGINKLTDKHIKYSGEDVITPFLIYKLQRKELNAKGYDSISKLEFEVIPALGDMELNGMYLDTTMWKKLSLNSTQ